MDFLVFFSLISFQLSIVAVVAIVFGQNKIAEKALGSLTSVLEKGMHHINSLSNKQPEASEQEIPQLSTPQKILQ